jgi:hypothetical protein
VSRPRIFRFPSLANVRAAIHGGGYKYLEDLPEEERRAAPAGPNDRRLGLARAALHSGVRDREATFRARGYPPKVFISYRWESDELRSWVARLGRHIEQRGFPVFLDQDVEVLRENDPVEIGRFVSVIVDCQIIVCVFTPQYAAGLSPRLWLFEERQLMNLLARRGVRIVRLIKEGPPPEETMPTDVLSSIDWSKGVGLEAEVPDHQGFLVDMTGASADRFESLDPHLRDPGPQVPAEVQHRFRPWLERVVELHEAGDDRASTAEFARGSEFGETSEYRRLAAHVALGQGETRKAAELALAAASDRNATPETLIDLAILLRELDENKAALHALSRVPWWLGEEWSWRVHFVQGDALDDLGSYIAALAHLRYALDLSDRCWIPPKPTTLEIAKLQNTVGYVYLFRFGAPAAALPHLEAAWRGESVATNGVNLIICRAALNDYEGALELWRTLEPGLSAEERDRFADLPAALSARRVGTPPAVAQLPGSTPDSWRCPACSAELLMAETTFLCVSCGTAFVASASACPCCASTVLAGAGALTSAGPLPPKCPICSAGVPMEGAGFARKQ